MYGVDLLDFWRGELPARKVFRLVRMLPDTSRTTAQMASGSDDPAVWLAWAGWGTDRRLMHTVVRTQLKDNKARVQWDRVIPTRKNERSGSLQSFAPTRRE